jgi:UDP-2,3-diacylglucosamine pyrophosphatase LpxH
MAQHTDEKTVTLIVSDLHLGGGAADPGDDHVYQYGEFSTFIAEQAGTKEGQRGNIELIINGDFLEFAQVKPEAYTLGSTRYWCSEAESLQKLDAILAGHADIFQALKEFQRRGNQVTIAAGNHDVDFYWKKVQGKVRQAIGQVQFELGATWYSRYNGRLQISHGHMFDPANRFDHWEAPILNDTPDKTPRLEMCPGTLFMVKFLNELEHDYPFADNLKPVTALGRLLWREERLGLLAVAWMLSRFLGRHPVASLDRRASLPDIGRLLVELLADNPRFRRNIVRLYRQVRDPKATTRTVVAALDTAERMRAFLYELMPKVSPIDWLPLFDVSTGATLGRDDRSGTTLSIALAATMDEKEVLRYEAQARLDGRGREVVVLGHTHQPDEVRKGNGGYFNPGSWTRYVEIGEMNALRLEDLGREDDFPYQLNYIRVEKHPRGSLRADKICYKEERGSR